MKQCYKCGAVLPAGAQDVCFSCGAVQPQGHEHNPQSAAKAHKHKSDRTLLILGCAAAVLTVLLIAACATTFFMYRSYNADKSFAALSAALRTEDIKSLKPLVQGDGVAVTQDGLTALCRAFDTQEKIDALIAQLRAQLAADAGQDAVSEGAAANSSAVSAVAASASAGDTSMPYPAISLSRHSVFLGYASYGIRVQAVSLLLPNGAQNPVLTMDGKAVTGTASPEGILYSGLFPGKYTCQLSAQTLLGITLAGPEKNVELFNAAAPYTFAGDVPIANITVTGVPNDAATIYVNATEVSQKAAGGTVSLPQVGVGSIIAFSYKTEYGAVTTGSTSLPDLSATALTFGNVATEGGIPPEADLISMVSAFYASYLDALNVQDVNRIIATDLLRSTQGPGLSTDSNKATLFQFGSANVAMGQVVLGAEGDVPTLTLNAAFHYTATNREKLTAADKTSYYTCQFVFQSPNWVMNRIKPCTVTEYEGGTLLDFNA